MYVRRHFVRFIEAQDFKTYVEPFCGAANVFFYKDKWCAYEVLNDLNGDIFNVFVQIKDNYKAVMDELLSYGGALEGMYYYLKDKTPKNDIERAAIFIYLQTYSFGGLRDSDNKGIFRRPQAPRIEMGRLRGGGKPASLLNKTELVKTMARRLDKVGVVNMDALECIGMYDSEFTMFYCDPPYFSELGYKHEIDHVKLRDTLANIKGKFSLSYNDCLEVRELYKDFYIHEFERRNMANNNSKGMYQELFITNYEPKIKQQELTL